MKGVIKYFGFFALLLAVVEGHGQSGSAKSPMIFDHTEWDFGTFNEVDGKVKHVFMFTNRGAKPFVIQDVSVSCGCTMPTYSKEPVRPGGSGSIEIIYDPQDRPGVFDKDVYIIGAGGIMGMKLKIKGEVIGAPRGVEDDYPVLLSAGLRLTTRSVSIGYVVQNTTMAKLIGYVNTSNGQVTLSAGADPSAGYFRVAVPAVIAPGEKGELSVTYDLRSEKRYGMLPVNVYLTVNGRRESSPVLITAIGIDNFKGVDPKSGPECHLSATHHNFGEIRRGASISKEMTLTNNGAAVLILRDVKAEKGCSTTLKSDLTLEPGKSVTFRVAIDANESPVGRVFRSVSITTNDPARPFREIRLVATVVN